MEQRIMKLRFDRSRLVWVAVVLSMATLGFVRYEKTAAASETTDVELQAAPTGQFDWIDGERRTRVYVAGPEDAAGAVLIVHDWFGVTRMTRETVERFAAQGYRVAAVDLYDGEAAEDHPGAQALMGQLDPSEIAMTLRTVTSHLSGGGRPVVSVGFSMGGAPAFRAVALSPGAVVGAASVYGGGVEQIVANAEDGLGVPLLLVTGSDDAWPMASVDALVGGDAAADAVTEVHVIPAARHGYAQPLYAGGANLDAEATRVTWLLLDDFVSRLLK